MAPGWPALEGPGPGGRAGGGFFTPYLRRPGPRLRHITHLYAWTCAVTVTSLTSASAKSSLHRGLPPACCLGHWDATACIYLVDSGGDFLPRQAPARHALDTVPLSVPTVQIFTELFQCRARVVRVSALHYATREKKPTGEPGRNQPALCIRQAGTFRGDSEHRSTCDSEHRSTCYSESGLLRLVHE